MAAVPSIGRATRIETTVAPEADATRDLYERYANQIFGYCLHQLGSREEAEDAVQSTFLNAFRGLRKGIVPEAESAWLFKIAQNVCLSRHRSSWRRGRIESPTDFELVEEVAPAPSRRSDELIGLQDVLEQMPENQRRAILLREWQGLSYREIGAELELSQAAVETLIFRARRSLAQGLETSPAEQRSWRARVKAVDLGSLVGALKSLLASGAAVKMGTAAAVVAVSSVAATAPATHHRHAPAAKPHHAPVAHATSRSTSTSVAAPLLRAPLVSLQPRRPTAVRKHVHYQPVGPAPDSAAPAPADQAASAPPTTPPAEQPPAANPPAAPAAAPEQTAPQQAPPAQAPPAQAPPAQAPPAAAAAAPKAQDKPKSSDQGNAVADKPKSKDGQGQSSNGGSQTSAGDGQGQGQHSDGAGQSASDRGQQGQQQGQHSDGAPPSAPAQTSANGRPQSVNDNGNQQGGGNQGKDHRLSGPVAPAPLQAAPLPAVPPPATVVIVPAQQQPASSSSGGRGGHEGGNRGGSNQQNNNN